jgi:cysteine synthase
MDILHAIGNTSMVRLRKVVPPNCADIFVKLEWENPTGSMKDRMALAVIRATVSRSSPPTRSARRSGITWRRWVRS